MRPAFRRVSFADLDLVSPDGQSELHRRVGKAITFVCGTYPVAALAEELERLDACRKAAKLDAGRQLASRRTNAVYALAALR